mgnify:CR=1 FL=1|tara:strand:+ start:541 stop:711 length:171 start_codon:yes stop_codon:yes gene_type:complete
MKLNGVRSMLIVSLIIILLYILGLFLPIIKNTKTSKIYDRGLIIKIEVKSAAIEYI